jgi:hypothetical protein
MLQAGDALSYPWTGGESAGKTVLDGPVFYSTLIITRFNARSRFFSRKSPTLCKSKQCCEIDDFAILSLTRLPIPPPWFNQFS